MNSTPYKERWLITDKKCIKIRILSGVQRNIYIYTHVLSSWEQLFKVVHLWFLKSTFCFQTQFYNEDEFNSIWKRWLITGNKYIRIRILIYIYIDTYVLSSWEQLFKSVYLLFLKGTFHFQTHFIMKINSLHMKSDDWSQARAKKFLRIRIQRNKQNLARKNKNFCHN